ncbi:MAG: aminoacyl-tRNA hydrolase [Methylobacter sp.]
MIRLIVGLGNPGRQYEKTRHNAGFLFLDRLAFDWRCAWVKENKFDGFVAEAKVFGEKIILLKPDTFMNRSGLSVGKVVRYYKFVPEAVLVVHDELDFDVGVMRLKRDGGHAGHNGLKDIISHLGSKDFYRLRVGVGRPSAGENVADFVLSSPSKKEWDAISSGFDVACSHVEDMATGKIAAVMSKLNSM